MSIEDRIRGMYASFHAGKGNLGLAFEGAASPEEATVMQANGMVKGGAFEGNDLWFIDLVNRPKGPIELEVESSIAKGDDMGWFKHQLRSLQGELGSMYLQGLNDAHNAIVPAFPDSQRGVDQMGTPLAPTPKVIDQDLDTMNDRSYERMLDKYDSAAREQREEDRGMERD